MTEDEQIAAGSCPDSTFLYRHFASDGSLLYVGISLSWPARTKAHAGQSRWFDQVARVEIERFPTRDGALEAERTAIKSERPKFNIVHNRDVGRSQRAELRHGRYFHGPNGRSVPHDTSSSRFLSSRERRRLEAQKDPVLKVIKGPDAIVGPALVYRGDTISVMVAHGHSGTAGELAELVLGGLTPEVPEWAHACASVITISRANDLTMDEARDVRSGIIRKLRAHLREVDAFDTDIALAVANASRFPSARSRQILNEIAVERGVTT